MNTNVAAKFVSSCMRRFDPKGLYSEEWLLEEPVQALMLLQNWGMFYFEDGKMPKWLDRCIELCVLAWLTRLRVAILVACLSPLSMVTRMMLPLGRSRSIRLSSTL